MIEIPKQAKALIFDLDGTIANTMQNHFTAWRKAILPYGIDFNAGLFMQLTGMPRKATINKLNELFGTSMDPNIVGNIKGTHYYEIDHGTKEISVVTDIVRKYHSIYVHRFVLMDRFAFILCQEKIPLCNLQYYSTNAMLAFNRLTK